jgi:hypothetical protein
MKKVIIAALLFLGIHSCSKTEDVFIKNNQPPTDKTIDSSTILLYINKTYINLMGREPVGNERAQALSILNQNNFSIYNRKQFLDNLLNKPEYKRNLFIVANAEFLNSIDSSDVANQIYLFQLFVTQPQYAPFVDILNMEIARMTALNKTKQDLVSGALDYKGMLKRITNNYFYDQINMGTENFVVFSFINYLFRYPSDAELAQGKIMVDGNNATLFLQLGNSKSDFINIFFDSNDYFEGQVRYIFKKYLFREPTSAEITFYANPYKATGDYTAMQKNIFSTDEYAGIK